MIILWKNKINSTLHFMMNFFCLFPSSYNNKHVVLTTSLYKQFISEVQPDLFYWLWNVNTCKIVSAIPQRNLLAWLFGGNKNTRAYWAREGLKSCWEWFLTACKVLILHKLRPGLDRKFAIVWKKAWGVGEYSLGIISTGYEYVCEA